MLFAAKFLDRVAFVSVQIFLQNLISVDFIKEYQVTIVFAVPLSQKKDILRLGSCKTSALGVF